MPAGYVGPADSGVSACAAGTLTELNSMLLGLITDVHNHSPELARALDLLLARGVDRVVTIGDTCDAFASPDGATEVASLLAACGAVGVWGNHDFGLCRDISDKHRARFGPVVLDYMARMQPFLEIENCYFSHREASVDAHDVVQLWSMSDAPLDLMACAMAGFAATRYDCQFVGHYHRWWATTPRGRIEWEEGEPLVLRPSERYFVVVAAVCDGWCAILDTISGVLQPLTCSVR
jgi:predicted phosphodiesterase